MVKRAAIGRRAALGLLVGAGLGAVPALAQTPGDRRDVAQIPGGRRDVDVARARFAANLSRARGLKPGDFQVSPFAGVEDDSALARLKTGSLYAWTALDPAFRVLANGFAGAGPGIAVAFEGYVDGLGRPAGLAALMQAMEVLDPRRRMALEEIIPRVAFCLNRLDRAERVFDADILRSSGFEPPDGVRAPTLHAQASGVMLTYFTMVQGHTGTFDIWRVDVSILPSFDTVIHRQSVSAQ